ncbi:2Fe-2S iron-sulfur cluster-binding protein [Fictibacillus sp. FJAT-27399]|uniref:2Fe-2S iron-sulfur cluster-binding protein n=1 Tax=Fictibacillus sp. FJAT-27399 TaxID=1729689 RepID=UPI0007848B28|nr:2Fe-2S iron-sulfur cluster-binding protein [Fictibacillus sp. FJAT-27399]
MDGITIFIKRDSDGMKDFVPYSVNSVSGKSTVLEVLESIREEQDGTLAIRYGCRFKSCGLCAVTINGNSRMACLTKVKDQMRIEPLLKIPVVRDLIVERAFITETMKKNEIYPIDFDLATNEEIKEEFKILSKCTDCLSCLSSCGIYDYDQRDECEGPLFFVKLALLQNHPHNRKDFTAKAKKLGVEKYRGAGDIPCPYGIPIKKLAIEPFLK